jgi:hypothetical protein
VAAVGGGVRECWVFSALCLAVPCAAAGRYGNHAGTLAKTSFFMWFMRAIQRVNLLAISIILAILIYFDCVPAISIAILIYFDLFWSILIYFDLFWSILIYFDLFWSILIYFDLFQSFQFISIYFNHFDLFRFISIYFNSFRFQHRNHQNISMVRRPFRSFHHVTAKMAHDGCCCHLTFASITPIM